MTEDEKQQLRDIRAEERQLNKIAHMLGDPRCDLRTYIEAIRAFGLHAEPEKYEQLLALWRKRRGNG